MPQHLSIDNIIKWLKDLKVTNSLILKASIGIVVFLLALDSFYTVQHDEQAVVQTFGEYTETVDSGLQFKLPVIQHATLLKTKQILQAEFGYRTRKVNEGGTEYTDNKGVRQEASMISGDLNVADVRWAIQYQITDPSAYLFNTRSPVQNIRDVSESVMRRLVGDRMVSEVLTVGRAEIETESKPLIQEVLNRYNQGTTIVSVQLQDIDPPEAVKDAFNEVNKSKQDQEKMINEAEQEYNRIIPKAQGLAAEEISRAEGYATATYNKALGDVAKFDKIQTEYKLAPAITRKRIYLDAMEEIFSDRKIIFVDSSLKNTVVPLLNLQKNAQESK